MTLYRYIEIVCCLPVIHCSCAKKVCKPINQLLTVDSEKKSGNLKILCFWPYENLNCAYGVQYLSGRCRVLLWCRESSHIFTPAVIKWCSQSCCPLSETCLRKIFKSRCRWLILILCKILHGMHLYTNSSVEDFLFDNATYNPKFFLQDFFFIWQKEEYRVAKTLLWMFGVSHLLLVIWENIHVWIWMNSSPSKALNYHTLLQF